MHRQEVVQPLLRPAAEQVVKLTLQLADANAVEGRQVVSSEAGLPSQISPAPNLSNFTA